MSKLWQHYRNNAVENKYESHFDPKLQLSVNQDPLYRRADHPTPPKIKTIPT